MKFFLLTVALLVASAAAAPNKVKRDILPGDSRYATDYHVKHHHANSRNSVGSGYLPPVPSAPAPTPQVNNQYLAPAQDEPSNQRLQLPSTSYGVPFNSNNVQENNQYLAPAAPSAPVTSYGTPVQAPQNVYVSAPAPVVRYQPAAVVHQQPTQQVVHHQPAPVYGPPAHQPAPVVHQQPAQQVVQYQPAPVAHQQSAPVYAPPAHQPAPVVHHQSAPVVHHQPTPVYGPPVRQSAPVVHHQPATVFHHQPAPVYGPPARQSAPVVHHQPAQQVVHHQPVQQVVHHQPAPVVHYSAPVVHQQPDHQKNFIFEAPVQSMEVFQSHTVETVPSSDGYHTDSDSVDSSNSYSQQQTDSNGGYVY